MIFEDTDGTRLLYDAGRTVAVADGPPSRKIDAILVSHMHGDYIGDRHTSAPNTNTVNIALAKNAKIVVGSKMRAFFREKLRTLGGNPKNSVLVSFGTTKMVGGVKISTVPALHSNGVNPAFIGGEMGKAMKTAAFVINRMIRPKSVIVSHANEPAIKGGKIIAGTRTATFKKAVRTPVHLPLSGKTMEFDGSGKCVAVCTPPL